MKSIYSYSNYCEYLKAFYAFSKKSASGFSYERFSVAAGVRSPNYFKLVADGQKNLTPSMILRFAKGLGLDFSETQYFEALVLENQSERGEEKKYYLDRMRELRKNRPRATRISNKSILAHWSYPAILSSAHGLQIDQAAGVIHKMTGLSSSLIQNGLRELAESQYLLNENGKYLLTDQYLYLRDQKTAQILRKNFLKEQLVLSSKAFQKRYESGDAKFFSQSFTINTEDYSFFVEQMDQLLESMVTFADQKKPNKVLQLNAQMFCLNESLASKER